LTALITAWGSDEPRDGAVQIGGQLLDVGADARLVVDELLHVAARAERLAAPVITTQRTSGSSSTSSAAVKMSGRAPC
jgi:hypothetical protein